MKYVKTLGLLAVAATALMVFASSASATILTDPVGKLNAGTLIRSEAEKAVTLHPPIGKIECAESTIDGNISKPGGAEETVSVTINTFTFSGCNATVTVLKSGSLEIHTEFESTAATSHQGSSATGDGTVTSSGAEITLVFAGFHCIFSTNNTDLGTLTGSHNFVVGKHGPLITYTSGPTLDLQATLPRTGGSSGIFCGSTAAWTGSYEILSPFYIDVD